MVVRYSRCEVNREESDKKKKKIVDRFPQTRIRIESTRTYGKEAFDRWKRVIKGVPFTEYQKNKTRGNFWHIPATALALVECATAIKTAYPGVKQFLDPFCDELRRTPTRVGDVKVRPLPRAILEPWDHQRVGAHLVGQLSGVMLAYDMGTGKTKTVLDAIVEYGMRRTFIVCPKNVIDVWTSEAGKHFPRDFHALVLELGSKFSCAKRRDMIRDALEAVDRETSLHALLCVINYEAIASPHGKCIRELVGAHDWDLVVADECHRAANWSTNTGRFLCRRMVHRARHRVGLSGTPLGNGPQDAYGQYLFVDPGLFGEYVTRFRSRYLVMGGFEGKQVLDYQNEEEFRQRMARLTVVVKLRDVLDLPPERDEERLIQLEPRTLKVYRELRDEFIADWNDGVIVGDNVLTRLLRLAQVTSGFSKVKQPDESERLVEIGTEKQQAVRELLEDIAREEPVVVFCRFVPDLHQVKRAALMAGDPTGSRQRPCYTLGEGRNEIKAWRESCDRGEGPVIAVQLQAGGVGIDLTRACYAIYFSIGFHPIDFRQSRARVMRPGQGRAVIYYHLIAPGTVDRLVYRSQGKKKSVVDSVINDLVNARDLV